MNLVDSPGWLEYFADSKNAKHFTPIIENTELLIISPINIYEVYKKVLIEKDEYVARQIVGIMQQARIIEITPAISIEAAILSHQYKLPMADSLIYATAKIYKAILWTQDADFKGLYGVKYFKKN